MQTIVRGRSMFNICLHLSATCVVYSPHCFFRICVLTFPAFPPPHHPRRTPFTRSSNARWGCFEEQVRHWWSNECPVCVCEELCHSAPVWQEGKGYDATMRVGFSLHRVEEPEKEEEEDEWPGGSGKLWLSAFGVGGCFVRKS